MSDDVPVTAAPVQGPYTHIAASPNGRLHALLVDQNDDSDTARCSLLHGDSVAQLARRMVSCLVGEWGMGQDDAEGVVANHPDLWLHDKVDPNPEPADGVAQAIPPAPEEATPPAPAEESQTEADTPPAPEPEAVSGFAAVAPPLPDAELEPAKEA